MKSSDICGRETYPAGNPPDCLSPLDDDPPVHHDAQSTGPSAQRPRHPVHSGSRTDNYHTSGPPVRHRWAGCPARLLYLTMAPLLTLTSSSTRLPRDLKIVCRHPFQERALPKRGLTRTTSRGEHYERDIKSTHLYAASLRARYNPRLPRYGVTMGDDRMTLCRCVASHKYRWQLQVRRLHFTRMHIKKNGAHRKMTKKHHVLEQLHQASVSVFLRSSWAPA